MKYFIAILTCSFVLFAGCQQTNTQSDVSSENSSEWVVSSGNSEQLNEILKDDDGAGKLIIEQQNPDGTSEVVMVLGEDQDSVKLGDESSDSSNPMVLPDTKGMPLGDNGFLFEELRVKPGTKIIFQNTGEEDHWPSVNPPERWDMLKAPAALGPDEVFEFVFPEDAEVGEYPIHDILNPDFEALLIVE